MVRILPPVLLPHRKVPRDKRNRQTQHTRDLEADMPAHREPRVRAMDQKTRADQRGRCEYQECEGGEEGVYED